MSNIMKSFTVCCAGCGFKTRVNAEAPALAVGKVMDHQGWGVQKVDGGFQPYCQRCRLASAARNEMWRRAYEEWNALPLVARVLWTVRTALTMPVRHQDCGEI